MPHQGFPWDAPTGVGADFQPTAWTDLRSLASGQDPERQRDALERLCRTYWKPIYAFIRRRGHSQEAARDLTQDFFHHLLCKERLKLVDQRRGRFRSFILRALQNFLASDWDRRTARKRDERVVVSLDEPTDDGGARYEPPSGGDAPDQTFDRLWALDLLATVRRRLETDLTQAGKAAQIRLLPLAMLDEDETRYGTVAAELGMAEPAVRKAIERLRLRWATLLREEVAATVQTADDIDAELREVLAVLGR